MKHLWIVLCELSLQPGDLEDGRTLAFCNIVTWAEQSKAAEAKIEMMLATYNWILLEISKIEIVDETYVYDEALSEIIEQAQTNPNAILLSTFHTYPAM